MTTVSDDDQSTVSIRRQELLIQEKQLELRRIEVSRGKWNNAMSVALISVAVAGLANAGVAYYSSVQDDRKAEQARVLEALRAPPDKAAENLQFLLDTGLITDPYLRQKLTSSLKNRVAGQGPSVAPTDREMGFTGYSNGGRNYGDLTSKEWVNPNVDIVKNDCKGSSCPK